MWCTKNVDDDLCWHCAWKLKVLGALMYCRDQLNTMGNEQLHSEFTQKSRTSHSLNLQIARSYTRRYVTWALSLVAADDHFNLPLGFVWVITR